MGTRLVSKLTSQGHSVRVLTRNPNAAAGKLPYPRVEVFGPNRWNDAVKGASVVINLAGEPHAGLCCGCCSMHLYCAVFPNTERAMTCKSCTALPRKLSTRPIDGVQGTS